MIRVFVLALLALVALVAIVRNLPGRRPADSPVEESGAVAEQSPLSRWQGAWEGTLTTHRPDGETLSNVLVFQQNDAVSPTEQAFSIIERRPDGRTQEVRGKTLLIGDRFERHFQGPDGSSVVYSGRQEGSGIFWHREDPEGGLEEAFREEIIGSDDGDLYTIDGMRRLQSGREVLLIKGRLRRAIQDED